ncbi:glycosyltransferase family 2 protein [Knoellia sp. Soil729]|uniref:glycosyltransferase family 2 protein n=1 Tax=Knoellia sp. Soil729 TaxID=1736394 RepID=UPI000AD5110B
MPVFNVAAYVNECVESVLSQSHSQLEVILVNDGSTDDSGALCDAFAARDPRVRVIHQGNAGLSTARNVGLTSSTGRLVTFLDGDDWWNLGFVAALVTALDDHPSATVAMSSYARVPGGPWVAPVTETTVLSVAEALGLFAGPDHGLFTTACAKLYRREVLEGVTFPPGRLHEDEFTTYRVLMSGPVALVPEPLYLYRQRSDGITASILTPARLTDAIEAADQQAVDLLSAGHMRAAGWAQDQAFRKRLRLVELVEQIGDRNSAAAQSAQLAAAARTGTALPRPRALRLARLAAARWPRSTVRAFSLFGRARNSIRRGPVG